MYKIIKLPKNTDKKCESGWGSGRANERMRNSRWVIRGFDICGGFKELFVLDLGVCFVEFVLLPGRYVVLGRKRVGVYP